MNPDSNTSIRLPLYAKATLILLGLYVFVDTLSLVESILLPLIFATIIAIIVVPFVNFLIKKGWGPALSSFVVMLLSLIIIAGIIFLIVLQANKLGASWPQLTAKFEALFLALTGFVSEHLSLSSSETDTLVSRIQDELLSNGGNKISITVTNLGGFMAMVMLTPRLHLHAYLLPAAFDCLHSQLLWSQLQRPGEQHTDKDQITNSALSFGT